jgi:hypothetical protein
MSSEIPPTYYFSGINYNPDFYQSSSSSYLSYPIAQGTETIKSLRSAAIDSTSASTNMTLGSNLTSGSLTIGGSSLHTGTISLGAAQTTGALNIGNGARTGAGAINIGNQAAGTIAITVGTASKSTTALNGTVSVGSSMNTTGIVDSGTISSTGAITGLSFTNTANSASITSGGIVGGNALTIANTGYISVGGLAAITNGIHVVGEIRSTTGNFTATAGDFTATAGNFVGAYKNAATPSASITSAGTITGTSLALGSGGIGCGAITSTGAISGTTMTASGLINANAGLTVASGQTLTLNGTLTTNSINGTATNSAQTIGGNILDGSITVGGALTTGSIALGGAQTTGDINIGVNSASDIYIGNATSATAGLNVGTCHISKCQIGTNGTTFRQVLCGVVAAGSGSATVSFGVTLLAVPIVVATINSTIASQIYSLIVSPSTTGFTYTKTTIVLSGATITAAGPATSETFNWVAYVI